MYTSEQIRQIYARLGLSVPGSLTPDRKNLFQLQQAFLMTVPYENLDILAGIPLSLSEDALFDKLVTRRRGGYCFEINGFFAVLLRSIGYTVTEYLARYLRGETAIPMRRHRVLRVTANDGSEWIVDAGIGQESFRQPLPYGDTNAETDDGFRVYRLRRRDFYGWVIEDHLTCRACSTCQACSTNQACPTSQACAAEAEPDADEPVFRPFYSFTEEPQLPCDYEMPSFWCEKHPDSPFTKAPMLAIRTPRGRIAIDGDQLSCYEDGAVQRRNFTKEEYPALLRQYFGIR